MPNRAETYIAKNDLEGTKIADVLREFEICRSPLGVICAHEGYSIDQAMAHLKAAGY
jgi:hypothetical protein